MNTSVLSLPAQRRRRWLLRFVLATVALLVAVGIAFRLHPPLLLGTVDAVRGVIGPAPIAYAETAVFRLGTLVRQLRVQLGDTAPRWTLQIPPTPQAAAVVAPTLLPTATPAPTDTLAPTDTPLPTRTPRPAPTDVARTATLEPTATPTATPEPTVAPTAIPTPVPTTVPLVLSTLAPQSLPAARADWPPVPLSVVINDGQLPNEGQWQLLNAVGDGGAAAMAVTALRPDPARPDIQVAVVAVDLTRAQLHTVAGMEEPPPITGTATLRYGQVPATVQGSGRLLAAFNGGFKAIHGNDGMAADGQIYLPAVPNRATIAIAGDGSVRLGLWGRDFGPDSGLVAFRQNGHLLVDDGVVTERAQQGGLGWGTTVDLQAETWRSGVGLSADGRTLFYAVGDALTAAGLAEVLRASGAWAALQLDINNYYVRFVTFQQTDRLVAVPLISAMQNEPRKYLVPEARDFFYLTGR